MSKDMDDFDLLSPFTEEVVQAHELMDSEREPYVEEPEPANSIGQIIYQPFYNSNGGWFGTC